LLVGNVVSKEEPPVSSSNLVRLSGLTAVLGSVLFLVAELLSFVTETEDFRRGEWATSTPFLFTWTLFLLGGVLLQIGLVGLYVRQSEAAGIFGLVGFVAAFLGTALAVGASWSQLFIAPDLMVEAPDVGLPQAQPAGVPGVADHSVGAYWFSMSFGNYFPLGWFLFGVATLIARVYPLAVAIALIAGTFLANLPVPLSGVVLYVAVAWLGFILFTGRGEAAPQPARVS
jgi:hypothetical protein